MKTDTLRKQLFFNHSSICTGDRFYLFGNESSDDDGSRVIVLEAWPKLRAWRRLAGSSRFERTNPEVNVGWFGAELTRQWQDKDPESYIFLSKYDETLKQYVWHYPKMDDCTNDSRSPEDALDRRRRREFAEAIPLPVMSRIIRFPDSHWRLLQLCSKIPEFLTLIDSNPALAFALANAEQFRNAPAPSIASLRAKAKLAPDKLAAWLGFSDVPNAGLNLAKILANACQIKPLLALRCNHNALLSVLQRVETIDWMSLRLLVDRELRTMFNDEFIIEFAALKQDERKSVFEWIKRAAGLPYQFNSIAEFKARKWAVVAHSLLQGRNEDGDDAIGKRRLSDYLPEPPSFLQAAAPMPDTCRYFRVSGAAVPAIIVSDGRFSVDTRAHNFSAAERSELAAWLEAALQKKEQRKISHWEV